MKADWHRIKWRYIFIDEKTIGFGHIESDAYPKQNPVLVTTIGGKVKVDYVKEHEYGMYFLRTRPSEAIAWADLPDPYIDDWYEN